jgi:arginine-tRNA-protein transferase
LAADKSQGKLDELAGSIAPNVTRQYLDIHQKLRFYLTTPGGCPYLPGLRERKVFTSLEDSADPSALNDSLTQAGFRRSQRIAYRPACDRCDACVSARIPAAKFALSRQWRRVLTKNSNIRAFLRPAEATEEQFWLLRRYLDSRHLDGGMADMTMLDYASMVEETPVRTFIVEYRDRITGDLVAAALTDALSDGLSMVYSFYDPTEARSSLGSFVILDHLRKAAAAKLPYVYLGYWVRNSDKMGYKARYRPLEILTPAGWREMTEADLETPPDQL